ncbi:MAG: hypothetical protein R3B95_14335 [Nitrospirales bacterium]|nr:hypothetical protein [Nitrospirales bacterium]
MKICHIPPRIKEMSQGKILPLMIKSFKIEMIKEGPGTLLAAKIKRGTSKINKFWLCNLIHLGQLDFIYFKSYFFPLHFD